jgi:hypothetical protein
MLGRHGGHRYFLNHISATVEMSELGGLGQVPDAGGPDPIADVITDFITWHTTSQEKAAG